MAPQKPTFELGLTMAGAVSAGAYTAGVIDFLLEALDAIDLFRRDPQAAAQALRSGLPGENPLVDPPHDVTIPVMSGASAGAMVTAITTAIFSASVPPVAYPKRPVATDENTGNPLYDSWVQLIHRDALLSTDDVKDGKPVVSLLNSNKLEKIVAKALESAKDKSFPRPYFPDDGVRIYFCVGNLRGVRYAISMSGGNAPIEHQMSMHADHVAFWAGRDMAKMPGHVGLLPLVPGQTPDEWRNMGTAALASGAFPVGLAARKLSCNFRNYVERNWFVTSALLPPQRRETGGKPVDPSDDPNSWESRAGSYRKLAPLDSPADFPQETYAFANIDGGTFNNEPFELCRQALSNGGRNPRNPLEATRAVVLIDPFPNHFDRDDKFDADKACEILNVVKRLPGALVSQARFKFEDLALLKDRDVSSRFAILPSRFDKKTDARMDKAIACGTLGGFGGFLSREFRHHDFMLGRRNCQRFLSDYFMLPADEAKNAVNPIVAGWKNVKPETRAVFVKRWPLRRDDGTELTDVEFIPIVPLLGKLASPDYTQIPDWPVQPRDLDIGDLRRELLARADAVKDALVKQYKPAWWLGAGMSLTWKIRRGQWIDEFAIQRVEDNLKSFGIFPRGGRHARPSP